MKRAEWEARQAENEPKRAAWEARRAQRKAQHPDWETCSQTTDASTAATATALSPEDEEELERREDVEEELSTAKGRARTVAKKELRLAAQARGRRRDGVVCNVLFVLYCHSHLLYSLQVWSAIASGQPIVRLRSKSIFCADLCTTADIGCIHRLGASSWRFEWQKK